jgi:uncharacterized protein YhaN
MKIDSIHIQHFGHFANYDLQFGRGPLALICGQNEAGKTTLLEFLRHLLFGFPERTPYNFGEGGELGGSAILTLSDQRAVELKRRKGRKNTVQARVGGRDAELDDSAFRQLLGNANANVFKTVFAFGLDELREGNEGLRDESVQSALFGGGLGGTFNPESLLNQLDSDAKQLFKPNASIPTINALAATIKTLAADVRKKTIRSDDYERREQAWKEAQQTANALAAELNTLRRKKEQAERLANARPRWHQQQLLRSEREKLVVPSFLPADAEHQFETAVSAIQRLTSELTASQLEIAEARRTLATLELDQTLLPLRAEIEECHRLIQSVTDARRDLPLRRGDREKLRNEIQLEVQRLRPGWGLEDLRSFPFSAATSHAFDELCSRREALDEQRTRLETRRSETQSAVQQNLADLEGIGEIQDVSALTDVLEQSAEILADQKSLVKEHEEEKKLTRILVSQRARLSPPLTSDATLDLDAIQRLPVPPKELLVRFDQESRQLEQRRNLIQQSLVDAEQKKGQLQRECTTLAESRGRVPSLDDLQQERNHRDELWGNIRSEFLDRMSPAAPATDAEAYENAVRAADHTADQIYEHADDVARREQLRRQLSEAERAVQRLQEESSHIAQDQADFSQRWLDLWQPCSLEPLEPELMLTWIDSFLAFTQTRDALVIHAIDFTACQNRVAAFESKLRNVLKAPEGELKSLLAIAKHQAKSAEESIQHRKRLDRDRKRLDRQLLEVESELKQWQETETQWVGEWKRLLAEIGLPIDWDAKLARKVLGDLRTTRERIATLSDLESRIAQMEQRIAEFDPRLRRICEKLQESPDAERPEITAESLHERLTDAARIYERRVNLEDRIALNQESERKRQLELTDWQTKREQWLARAEAENDDAFFVMTRRARQASELDSRIRELTEQLAIARGDATEEAFDEQLQTCEISALQSELADLNIAVQQQQQAADEARERAGSLRREFEELDGRDEAVLIQEELARQQAKLSTDVHRYVPLVFAKILLQKSIKRFERENQPQLIGCISRLFATMTGGRYVEIERPTSDRSALFVRRSDGVERTPDQLSTGTREQLYLAIRLGYVLHYCEQAEPLPIVMDDVLVNFDRDRALATLRALRDVAEHAQILFFTCHRHVTELVTQVFPEVEPQYLASTNGKAN